MFLIGLSYYEIKIHWSQPLILNNKYSAVEHSGYKAAY